ncbi:hypothetical protein L1987_33690 [Smallanthus sonchifolius]|uniref:Uncharacterized protein n=1 Tax=Smallanthus sonchifolius TaxID=185202 RepID=A0ACB9HT46_9ASTR|nr:hypothetical protein L1987_33690 [Smallanthus sonchifolius]
MNDQQIQPQAPKPYWRWSKQDFFPEESFQDWTTYLHALSHTYSRFKDRLLSRSQDSDEIEKLRKQSENDMKRCLTWWDLMWFGFGAVIGAGIFFLTGQEARYNAGPAIVLSYVASGFSAMLHGVRDRDSGRRRLVCIPASGVGRLRGVHHRRKHSS